MKRLVGLVLSVILIAGALILVAPRSTGPAYASGGGGPVPQLPNPSPSDGPGVTVPTIVPKSSPTPSPSPTEDEDPDDDGEDPGNINTDLDPSDDEPTDTEDPGDGLVKDPSKDGGKNGKGKNGKGGKLQPGDINYSAPSGTYSTEKLVTVATQLLSLGYLPDQVNQQVYKPFIIAGEAAWSNTWGAPRYGPAPGQIRTHQGQDVFCNFGDPVLAPEAGIVDYSDGGLGGITARVHTSPSSYWYLTHLSATNAAEIPLGSTVQAGDVVGFCGNSGNALTTPPHVHFGWYVNKKAKNPHQMLVRWLHDAELRVLGAVSKATSKRVAEIERLTLGRHFGDAFAPDLAEMTSSGESLWAAGSSPATGAFALAQAALQAALAGSTNGPITTDPAAAALAEAEAHDAEFSGTSTVAEWMTTGAPAQAPAQETTTSAPAAESGD